MQKSSFCEDLYNQQHVRSMVQESGIQFFIQQAVQYEKIFTKGHEVPDDEVVRRFGEVVDEFSSQNKDEDILIGVHCTHGVNRTGYLVCRYMIEHMNMDPEKAIRLFGEARGHPIERENYIIDLKNRPLSASAGNIPRRSGCSKMGPANEQQHWGSGNGAGNWATHRNWHSHNDHRRQFHTARPPRVHPSLASQNDSDGERFQVSFSGFPQLEQGHFGRRSPYNQHSAGSFDYQGQYGGQNRSRSGNSSPLDRVTMSEQSSWGSGWGSSTSRPKGYTHNPHDRHWDKRERDRSYTQNFWRKPGKGALEGVGDTRNDWEGSLHKPGLGSGRDGGWKNEGGQHGSSNDSNMGRGRPEEQYAGSDGRSREEWRCPRGRGGSRYHKHPGSHLGNSFHS